MSNSESFRALLPGGGGGVLENAIKMIGGTSINLELDPGCMSTSSTMKFDLNHDTFPNDFLRRFELVWAQEIIEHLHNPWRFLEMCHKSLTSNGHLILSTPNILSEDSLHLARETGYFRWFQEEDHEYHINPIPIWEILKIGSNYFDSYEVWGNGDFYFGKASNLKDMIKNNEEIIIHFSYPKSGVKSSY